jgi:hypothetical protein
MATLLIVIASLFFAVGLNRASAYAKAQRRAADVLIADPAPAARHALTLTLAFLTNRYGTSGSRSS